MKRIALIGAAAVLLAWAVVTASADYKEAPMLAAMVAAGELPPVEERLPVEPKVLEPLEAVGTYGGTLNVFANRPNPWQDVADSPERSSYPLRMNFDGSIEPDLALDYELADDQQSFTLHLREGMKWSNGDPFIAQDFAFMFNDIHAHEEINTWGAPIQLDDVTVIDDLTVRWNYNAPYPRVILDFLHWRGSDWMAYAPSTYLKKWHIEYNADANKLAEEEGFDSWSKAFHHHFWFNPSTDLDKPTMHPWVWNTQTSTIRIWDRNPYYYAVDTASQQLPYIDKIISQTVDAETYKLKVISGEADYSRQMALADFSVLKQNEADGNYRVVLAPGTRGSNAAFTFGLAHTDPAKRELFNNVDFRRAMSLAIDREEINDLIFLGLATPRQATISSNATFYPARWGEDNPWIEYDPDEANRMLDALGLDERNRDDIRLLNDEPLLLTLVFFSGPANVGLDLTAELVKEYWEDVGIGIQLNQMERAAIDEAQDAGLVDVYGEVTHGAEVYDFLSTIGGTVNAGREGATRFWNYWSAVRNGADPGEAPGEAPPELLQTLYDTALTESQSTVFGSDEYHEVRTRVYEMHYDNLFTIGTVGLAPQPIIYRANLGNIARELPPWAEGSLTFNYYSNMWYFK